MQRELLGIAYAWKMGDQWFHAASGNMAPPEAITVERYLIRGQIVLRLFAIDGGGIVRGAKAYFERPVTIILNSGDQQAGSSPVDAPSISPGYPP